MEWIVWFLYLLKSTHRLKQQVSQHIGCWVCKKGTHSLNPLNVNTIFNSLVNFHTLAYILQKGKKHFPDILLESRKIFHYNCQPNWLTKLIAKYKSANNQSFCTVINSRNWKGLQGTKQEKPIFRKPEWFQWYYCHRSCLNGCLPELDTSLVYEYEA